MRKPNYDFERSQRAKAKEEKAKEKAQRKQEKKVDEAGNPVETVEDAAAGQTGGKAD